MRVAVLADIHGNLPALDAVLGEVLATGVDAIVLNGDLADGPLPAETLDRLEEVGDRAIWVRGNGDRWLAEAFDGTYRPAGGPADTLITWGATQITRAHRDRLASLPMTVTADIEGLGPVMFCHATARDDNEMILVDSPMEQYEEAFAVRGAAPARGAASGPPPQTIVVGHSHMPFDRLAHRRRIVNPGSVGMPYGHDGAAWALLGPDVVLRRTRYDTQAAAAMLAASTMPDIEEFVARNVRTTPGDAEALAVFTKVAQEQRPST
ncbi:MAG: metallophosphoesterase family protein [Micromonosporaceae bacterium]